MKCTKTCGIGVAYQSRQCDSPRKETKLSELTKFDCFWFYPEKDLFMVGNTVWVCAVVTGHATLKYVSQN